MDHCFIPTVANRNIYAHTPPFYSAAIYERMYTLMVLSCQKYNGTQSAKRKPAILLHTPTKHPYSGVGERARENLVLNQNCVTNYGIYIFTKGANIKMYKNSYIKYLWYYKKFPSLILAEFHS
jgi:hypothetical protein